MKRRPELHPLSHDHHYGLVAARRLRVASAAPEALPDAARAFGEAWSAEIEPHFQREEALLLPEIERARPGHPLVARTLEEHRELRALVARLTDSGALEASLAAEIARRLDDHIRFEERVLFPEAETLLPEERLIEIGRALADASPPACRAR